MQLDYTYINSFSTAAIIPTYNEADNIEQLIEELLSLPINLKVVVVDDNSPDGTGRLVEQWVKKNPDQVYIVHRSAKLGLGTAHIAGIQKALHELNVDFVLTMDADFSHNPKYIPAIIDATKNYDVVIGSRYVDGGGTLNCNQDRILLSQAANFVTRYTLGFNTKDVTAGFRLYKRDVIESVQLDTIFSNGYSFLTEITFRCKENGWNIGEIAILFEDRRAGQTKISRQEIYRAMYTLIRLSTYRLSKSTQNKLVR